MKGSVNPLISVLNELSSIEQLCLASKKKADDLSGLLKKIYDFASTQGCNSGSIDELIVENVDAETIWEELNSRNLPLVRQLTSRIAKLIKSVDETLRMTSEEIDDESQQDDLSEGSENEFEGEEDAHMDDNANSDVDNEEDDEDESDGVFPDCSDDHSVESKDNGDDHSESDREKWLDDMDDAEMRRNDADYESDEDDIYVSNALYEDEEEDPDYRYEDFFNEDGGEDKDDYHGSEDEDERDEGEDSDEGGINEDHDDRSDVDSINSEKDEGPVGKKVEQLSGHQNKNQKLSSQIQELESQLTKEKSWDMKGEVKASERPENSLLEMYADIERLSKPTPVITEASTNDLETMIKDRIKNNRFNDVPVYREPEADKDKNTDSFELSQQKNATGLGELYAQEFLAKALNSQPEHVSQKLAAAREDAVMMWHKVSMRLDELSHFFFAPRPVTAEINVKAFAPIATLPSIQLEEVVPLVGSSASQSAPEEVLTKKRGRQGEDMTKADKKRLRKLRGKVSDADDGDKKGRKKRSGDDSDNEAINDRRVTSGKQSGSGVDSGSFSKSAAFFANLQSHAQAEISGIKSAVAAAGKNKDKNKDMNKNYKL